MVNPRKVKKVQEYCLTALFISTCRLCLSHNFISLRRLIFKKKIVGMVMNDNEINKFMARFH